MHHETFLTGYLQKCLMDFH